MAYEAPMSSPVSHPLGATQAYAMAAVCLAAGLVIGYALQGAQSRVSPARATGNAASIAPSRAAVGSNQIAALQAAPQKPANEGHPPAGSASNPAAHAMAGGRMPTLSEMKQMADKQAAPLLEKLKSDPNNSDLLMQVGAIYHSTHQFKEASLYYRKAVQADPKNVAARTKLAISLYRDGEVDQAIGQLNQALNLDPADANALFNLGMIKLQGKQDGKGAVAAWQQLLKTNPQLSSDRRATVQKLMADVLTTLADEHQIQGAKSHDGQK